MSLLDDLSDKDVTLKVDNYEFTKKVDIAKATEDILSNIRDAIKVNDSGVVLKVPGDPDTYRNVVGVKGDSLIIRASVGLGTDEEYKGDEYSDKYVEKELGRGTLEYELPVSELMGKKFSLYSLSKPLNFFKNGTKDMLQWHFLLNIMN